jgi:long-chain acyl-CoA synthetase
MHIDQVLKQNSKAKRDKPAIIFHDRSYTYGDLDGIINRISNFLLENSIKKGDRIGIVFRRVPELIFAFMGIIRIGGIVVPINFHLSEKRLFDQAKDAGISCLIGDNEFLGIIKNLKENFFPKNKVLVNNIDKRLKDTVDLSKVISEGNDNDPDMKIDEEDIVYLNYTSGTTGLPKGAITTNANMFWNTLSSVETLGLTAEDVHLCLFASYSHPHELFARAFYLGGTIVMEDNIYPKNIVKSISTHRVSCLMGVAPMFETLIPFGTSRRFDLSSLRIPESGGMITREELNKKFENTFGIPIYPVWGSTETTGIAIATKPGESFNRSSVGKTCLHYQTMIVDDNGNQVKDNEVGEFIVKGPGVCSSYYNLPEETKESFKDGWYYSKDLIRKDEEGNYFFVDRKLNMLKVGGQKVYPMTIEQTLQKHPAIAEVAVVPVSDKSRGEASKAIIVVKPDHILTQSDIKNYCREHLSFYEIPRFVEFRDYLPKTVSGKVLRKALISEESGEDSLESLRKLIDNIDLDVLKLLIKRGELILRIKAIRQKGDEIFYNPDREEEIIQKIKGNNPGPYHDEAIEEIFRKIIACSQLLSD